MKFLTVIILASFTAPLVFANNSTLKNPNTISEVKSIVFSCEELSTQVDRQGALKINGRLYTQNPETCSKVLGAINPKATVMAGFELTALDDGDVELCNLNFHCQIASD